jgi:flagellar biogenesis protein FliO
MFQQALAVFGVLGLLLAAVWALKRSGLATVSSFANRLRIGRRDDQRRIRVIERLVLTPQHSLHLMSIEGQAVIFATSPTICQPVELSVRIDRMPGAPLKSSGAC